MSRTAGFLRLNQQRSARGEDPFANPRNATAGSLKMLDPREVAQRPLDIMLYGLGECRGLGQAQPSSQLRLLEIWTPWPPGFTPSLGVPWQFSHL